MDTEKLIETLQDFLKSTGIKGNQIARSIGISGAQISLFLKGEYKMSEETKEKLSLYMQNYSKRAARRQGAKEKPFVMTKQAKSVFFICEECVIAQSMGVVYGHPGTGKSRTLKEYARLNPESVLIEVTPNITVKSFLYDVAQAIGAETGNTIDATAKSIVKCLKLRDTVLLIDEAENLRIDALEHIRRIWDFSKTPVILGGTETLLQNLLGTKREMAQLYRRVGLKWQTKNADEEELSEVCTQSWGLKKELVGGVYELTRGNLGKSESLVDRAFRLSELSSAAVSEELIQEASRMLLL